MDIRTGLGYDIHCFAAGRKHVLGGVEIPHEYGLEGHSDADVLLHALCDAILGALGLGDIGEHFPNTDLQYKDISSLLLLDEVNKQMREAGYRLTNVDCMLQAEEPNLKDYKPAMRNLIALRLARLPHGVRLLHRVSVPFLLVCAPLVYLSWRWLG